MVHRGAVWFVLAALAPATGCTLGDVFDGETQAFDPGEGGGGGAVIDVRARGAAGDGVTDDTDALIAALADGAAGGGTVMFPAGTYRVTRPLGLWVADGAALEIEASLDAAIASELADPGSGQEIGVLDVVGDGAARVSVHGLTIHHGAGGRGVVDGIRLGGLSGVDLEGLWVTGASRWGVALERVSGAYVGSSWIEDNRYGGLGLTTSSDVLVQGGGYSANGTTMVEDGYGIAMASSAGGPCVRVTVRGVTADGNLRKGLDVHSGRDVLFEYNTVSGFGLAGIYAVNEDEGKDVGDVVVRGNVVDGLGADRAVLGIDVGAYSELATPSGRFDVVDNTVRNTSASSSAAIFVRTPEAGGAATDAVVIADNVIENGSGPGNYAIRTDDRPVAIRSVSIARNRVHANTTVVAIGVLSAESVWIADNQISVDAGAPVYGIVALPPSSTAITGNVLTGTFETPIGLFDGQSASDNWLNGAPL